MRRCRLCIPVRLGRQGELPKGSLTLATSASGAAAASQQAPAAARQWSAFQSSGPCVCVLSGRRLQLCLATPSLAGSTLYVEPEPVVALNNAEMALAGEEEEEEQRVLAALSQLVCSPSSARGHGAEGCCGMCHSAEQGAWLRQTERLFCHNSDALCALCRWAPMPEPSSGC